VKKRIIGLPLLLLAAGTPAAQAQQSRIGLKAGGVVASYRGVDAYSGGSSRAGFCAGLVLHLPVSKVFSVQPEFLYAQKGADKQPYLFSNGLRATGTQHLDYFEVPVLAKLRTSAGPFVELGPTLGYLLRARADVVATNSQSASLDNRNLFKNIDFGYAVGAGFQSPKGLLLGLRYNGGLTGLFTPGSYSGTNGEARIYNQAIQFYLGYIFMGREHTDVFAQ